MFEYLSPDLGWGYNSGGCRTFGLKVWIALRYVTGEGPLGVSNWLCFGPGSLFLFGTISKLLL